MHNVLTDSGPAVPVMLGDKELTTYKKTVMLTHTNVTENHRREKKRTGSRRRPRNAHITWPFNDCWLMIIGRTTNTMQYKNELFNKMLLRIKVLICLSNMGGFPLASFALR